MKDWQQTRMQKTTDACSELEVATFIPSLGVTSRANRIQDWSRLARQANWSVKTLAKICGVSVRALERHFKQHAVKTPKEWLSEQRQKSAFELLLNGNSVKETAGLLGYQHGHNFSREFKKFWGYSPTHKTSQTARRM